MTKSRNLHKKGKPWRILVVVVNDVIVQMAHEHRPTPVSIDLAFFVSLLVGSEKPFAFSSSKGSIFWSSLHPNVDSFNAFLNFPVLDKDAGSSNTDGRRRFLLVCLSLLSCWGEKQTNKSEKNLISGNFCCCFVSGLRDYKTYKQH